MLDIYITNKTKILYFAYIAIQAAILGLWASQDITKTRLTVATNAVSLVAFLVFLAVSFLEHVKRVRTSTLLEVFLGLSILLDLPRVRTVFFFEGAHVVASLLVANLFVKLLLLVAEVYEKRAFLVQDASVEETAGFWNRSMFVWLNRLFFKGFKTVLTVDTMTEIDGELLAAAKPEGIVRRWEDCKSPAPNNTIF